MNFNTIANKETVLKTIAALKERGVIGEYIESKEAALERIQSLIPANSSVHAGASVTLDQIGFTDYLKSGTHGWNNMKEVILAEQDPNKQALLRKQAILSDFYLGSVHAVAETGEYVVGTNTASQIPQLVYSSQNVILVVSTKKIVPTLADAIRRLEEYVVPLEENRMRTVSSGAYGTMLSKELIVRNESPFNNRKVTMLLINEDVGF